MPKSYSKIIAHIFTITLISVIANVVLLFISRMIFSAPPTFSPFWWSAVIELTAAGVVAAGAVYYAMAYVWRRRLPSRSVDTDYVRLSIVLLILSFIPDVLMPFSHDADNQGATWPIVAALMVMHLAAAVIAIYGFGVQGKRRILKTAGSVSDSAQ